MKEMKQPNISSLTYLLLPFSTHGKHKPYEYLIADTSFANNLTFVV